MTFSSVQSLSRVRLFVTPWTTALQASLSITNSWSLLRLMSIQLVMPSNHLILCCPLFLLLSIFPSIRVFSMSQFLTSGGQSIGVSEVTPVVKNPAANTGNTEDLGSIPGCGRSGEGNSNPLQYSCLKRNHGERSLVGYSP